MLVTHMVSMITPATTDLCTLLDFSVAQVTVQVLQRITTGYSHPIIPGASTEGDRPGIEVIAVVQGSICGLTASGIVTKDRVDVKAIINRVSCNLDVSLDKRTIRSPGFHESLFSCMMEDFGATVTGKSLDVSWKNTVLRIGHLGPGYVLATGIALVRNAKRLGVIIERWKKHSSCLMQQLVFDVVQLPGDRTALDPLSTIQPSYLVQSGTPHTLRTDIIFRFFFQLRNSLWYLQGKPRDMWCSKRHAAIIDPDDFSSLLEAHLVGLDPDAYNFVHLSSLERFFPILRPDDSAPASRPFPTLISSVSVRLTNTVILILDPLSNSPNQLTVTELCARICERHADVIHLSAPNLATMSQTSLKDKYLQGVRKYFASISVGTVTLSMFPHLMSFAQRILQVQRSYHPTSSSTENLAHSAPISAVTWDLPSAQNVDIVLSLRQLCIQAAAENLVFEFGVSHMRGTSSMLSLRRGSQRMNTSVLFDQIYLRARSPSDLAKLNDQDILAAIELAEGKVNTTAREDLSLNADLRLVFATDLRIHVPRSALRLYRFIEEWRAAYLPGIEATLQALLSELHRSPLKEPPRTTSIASPRSPTFQVHGKLSYVGVSLQVMHGTWLSWEANSTIGYLKYNKASSPDSENTFGLRVESLALTISTKPHPVDVEPGTRVKLVLPPVSAEGRYNGATFYTVTLFEFVELKVKPSHWDTLLMVQQKFGQDFNDLVTLVQETQRRRSAVVTPNPINHQESTIIHRGFMKTRGFRVGFEGRSSTIYLECLDIVADIDSQDGLAWKIMLSDLAFSLVPRTAPDGHYLGFKRNHRSAFVIVDLEASAKKKYTEEGFITTVDLSGTKIHAVIQPSSIGEVGDFVDHLQVMVDILPAAAVQWIDPAEQRLRCWSVKISEPLNLPPSKKKLAAF